MKKGRKKLPYSKLAPSTKASRMYKKKVKNTKVGSGKRFEAMTKSLKEKGAKNPKALAAWIGQKKYGKKKMTKIAIAGKRRKKMWGK